MWRPTGLVDVIAGDLSKIEDPALREATRQIKRRFPSLFQLTDALINLNEGFAYDLNTRAGQIDALADLAALGVKAQLFRAGFGVVQRLAGFFGVRIGIEAALDLPSIIGAMGKLLAGDATLLEDLTKAINRAKAGPSSPSERNLLNTAVNATITTTTFVGDVVSFAGSPSILKAPRLILKGFDVAISILDLINAAIPFLPDVTPSDVQELETVISDQERKVAFRRGRFEPSPSRFDPAGDFKRDFDLTAMEAERAAAIRAKLLSPETVRAEIDALRFLRENPRRSGESSEAYLARISGLPPQEAARAGPVLRRFGRVGRPRLAGILEEVKKGR